MKVLITGATGLVGQEIVKLCHSSQIAVHYLTTSKKKIISEPNYQGFYWNPPDQEIDERCFDGVEVIMNLVGASIAERWTDSYKKEILNSRVETASLIFRRLQTIKHSVRHIVSASAIGIYPDSIQNYYTEDSKERDSGFLGEVVTKWEAAVDQFVAIGLEVSFIRIGLVLSTKGGAYPKIAKPVRYGLGAAFGTGEQWQSWIHLCDLARIFLYVVQEELAGIYNAVAPNPVSNQKLTETIAEEVNKKIMLPNIPKFLMKLMLGEMHQILYSSQRVGSKKIMEAGGFQFKFDNLKTAVHNLECIQKKPV